MTYNRWSKAKRLREATAQREAYSKANNKVKRLMRKAKRNFEKDIANNSKQNPKAFWSCIRSKLKTKAGVGPLLEKADDKTSIRFDDKAKADILQDQFCSVFTQEPESTLPSFPTRTNEMLDKIEVTEELVRNMILLMNLNKSCGPDEIHPRMLFELANELSAPLALLFRKTLQEGITPLDWTKAFVSPIYKKGNKNKAEDYRPISPTSIVCKIMEKLVKVKRR